MSQKPSLDIYLNNLPALFSFVELTFILITRSQLVLVTKLWSAL
nr:hypothetical protein [Nostoc sp. ChiQUE02]